MSATRLAVTFFVATLVTRLPFLTEHLWAWDSVLFARAIDDFDPAAHRPHPPGYLYYVLLARVVAAVTGDANRSLTIISAVAAAAAVVLVYLIARRLYDEVTARIAGIFLLTAVTFWAYGAVAYPYTLLAALTTGVALLFWRSIERGGERAFLVASAAWGVAIGFRSELLVFLAPVWLIVAWRAGPRAATGGAALTAAFVGVWLFATTSVSGGWEPYVAAVAAQSAYVGSTHSVLDRGLEGLIVNSYEMARFLGRGLYALALPLAALALIPAALRAELRNAPRAAFLALWGGVPPVTYLLLHVGDYGYVFSFLPALCVVAARGTLAAVRKIRTVASAVTLRRAVTAVAGFNAAIFLLTDTPLAAGDLARRDIGISEKAAYVRTIPASRVVVVSAYDALQVEHYAGGAYDDLLLLSASRPASVFPATSCARRMPCAVVVWDDILKVDGSGWETVRLASGSQLRVAHIDVPTMIDAENLIVDLELFDVASPRRPGRRSR